MDTVSCVLQFENSSGCYRPGEAIKGLVIFTVHGSNAILIKGLSIGFSGYASCKWEKPQENKKTAQQKPEEYYSGRQDYVSTKNFLIGSEEASPTAIQPGNYQYNFMVTIPINSPSSFESPLGCIRYDLQVNIHYPDHTDCLTECIMKVEKLKDLRRLASATQTPIECEIKEHKSCLRFWRQPLQLSVNIPQTAYVAGESISIHIKVLNHDKAKLKDITCKLNRVASYQAVIKDRTPIVHTDVTTIACSVHSLFGKNSTLIQHLKQLCVPATSPSLDFSECSCINLSYELEVIVRAQKQERMVKAATPIVVGSISLNSEVKILEHNPNSSHVPTISVARSMDELNLPSRLDMDERYQFSSMQQMHQISVSMTSLASSFKEADYMTSVNLNKKAKGQLTGDAANFKPKYLYYDLPEEYQTDLRENILSTSLTMPVNSTVAEEKC